MSPTPSRRRFLALCASSGSLTLAGCQSDSPSAETTTRASPATTDDPPTGLVWQKEIAVELPRADSPVVTDLLRLQYDRESGSVRGSFDPAYLADAVDGASVAVSESVHDSLARTFDDVAYRIYVGPVDGDDHLHVQARRAAFNDVPLAGTAAVETFWVRESEALRTKYARPTATTGPREPPADVDVRQFDLGERFDADY